MAKVNEYDRRVALAVLRAAETPTIGCYEVVATYREEIEARYAGVVEALKEMMVLAPEPPVDRLDRARKLAKEALAKIGRG